MVGKLIAQSDLKHLGCHTEMFVDAYADMIESGRMDGSRKNLDRFKATYTFAIGSQRMYDFMHNQRPQDDRADRQHGKHLQRGSGGPFLAGKRRKPGHRSDLR